MKQFIRDKIAEALSRIMRHFALDPRYFKLWEAHGYHISQVHYYSPLPDTRELSSLIFGAVSEMPGIDMNTSGQLELLNLFCKKFAGEFEKFPTGPQLSNSAPHFYFGNTSLESVDAEILYCMIRQFKPKRMIEIGSGFSTLLTQQALAVNKMEGSDCDFLAIEPYPANYLKKKFAHPVRLLVSKVQSVSLNEFRNLAENDILFIDSSHVCKIGSDVQYEFLEILPRLAPGVMVHIHDIFLPEEYPETWVGEWYRFWNEQYLLQAFLSCNPDFEVLWGGAWMRRNHSERLEAVFPSYRVNQTNPASFWIRRRK
jgi:hypothetical protein